MIHLNFPKVKEYWNKILDLSTALQLDYGAKSIFSMANQDFMKSCDNFFVGKYGKLDDLRYELFYICSVTFGHGSDSRVSLIFE